MSDLGDDIYPQKMAQINLKEGYRESRRFVTSDCKSGIIVLDRVSDIYSEKWYKKQREKM